MKKSSLPFVCCLGVFFSLLHFSCNSEKQSAPGWVKNVMVHEGISREYLFYAPPHLKAHAPLLVVLHGFTSNAATIMEYTGFNELAKAHHFAVVYPQGTTDAQGQTFWNVGYEFHAGTEIDDLEFIASLVKELQEKYALSRENTFATGMSNGGEMCYLLACEQADLFGAVAPVAGTMMSNGLEICKPAKSIPMLAIFGTRDQTTRYEGDEQNLDGWGAYRSIPDIIDFWTRNIQYNSLAIDTLADIVPEDSSFVIRKRYQGPGPENEFLYYEIAGGGHDWPGAWGNEDINASEEIWEFFARHMQ